jgi:hypothetical protein
MEGVFYIERKDLLQSSQPLATPKIRQLGMCHALAGWHHAQGGKGRKILEERLDLPRLAEHV